MKEALKKRNRKKNNYRTNPKRKSNGLKTVENFCIIMACIFLLVFVEH